MENAICINKQEVAIKEYQGQRVVTFKEIDKVHGRPKGTAGCAFRANREHFIENVDYFVLTPNKIQSDEIHRFGISSPKGGYLITESGYMMLCKSFGDKVAWGVQRQLVNVYFQKKAPIAEPPTLAQAVASGTRAYHGQPVMTLRDIYNTAGITPNTGLYYLTNEDQFTKGQDYLRIGGEELRNFKRENSGISKYVGSVTILFLPAVEKLCKKVGVKFNPEKFKTLPAPKEAPARAMKKAEKQPIEEKDKQKEKPVTSDDLVGALKDRAAAMNVIAYLFSKYGHQERYAYPLRNTAWLIATDMCSDVVWRSGDIMKYDPKPDAAKSGQ